jgi:hypothetical protein
MMTFIRPAGIVSRPVKGGRRWKYVRKGWCAQMPHAGHARYEVRGRAGQSAAAPRRRACGALQDAGPAALRV